MVSILSSIGGVLVGKGIDLIGNLFTSGAEKGIDAITEVVQDKFGIDLKSEDAVNNLTPEQIVALQSFEMSYKRDILQYIIAEKQIYVENTKSARDMQSIAMKVGGFQAYFTPILASVLIVFTIIYICCITFMIIPEQNVRFADTILGFLLGTVVGTIINYYWGSSIPRTTIKDVRQDLADE